MATRFYLLDQSVGTPAVTPAFDAGWEDTGGAVRRWMGVKDPKKGAFESISRAEAVTTSPYDVLLVQFVSAPLTAQTVSGTLKGQIRASESDADADFRAQLTARVVSNDGTTVRGTLVGLDASALSSEFATALTNRKFPLAAISPVTLSAVAAQAGDRIVVEVGFRSHNTHATSRTGSIEIGAASASDLPEDETTTTQANPWLEFSADLVFQTDEHRVTAANVQYAAEDSAPEHQVTAANLQYAAEDPAPEHQITGLLVQYAAEEYWYGWGVVLDSGDD